MQIYWIENKQKRGPSTVPDVLSMVRSGDLSADTLGWHQGCKDWTPLRELPALADFLADDEKAAEAEEQPEAETPAEKDAEKAAPAPDLQAVAHLLMPGPLPRFIARLMDTALYATFVLGLMYMLHVPYKPYFQPGSPLFWLPLPVLEALMLYQWRSTPGKRWMGIALAMPGRPSFSALLMRSILVFVMGMGCMLFPFNLITLALSYFGLMRSHRTLWDMRAGTLPVLRRAPSAAYTVAGICFLFLCVQLCSQYLQPWVPDMMRELQEQSPEAARLLEDWMPKP